MNKAYPAIGLLAVVVIALLAWQLKPVKTNTPSPTTNQQAQNSNVTTEPITGSDVVMKKATFKDGSYEAVGNYQSPGGPEEVDVKVSLKNGVITAAEFTGKGTNPTTKVMQGKFKEGFSKEVVGKPIAEVKLTVVNGSSLTPKGFMDALQKIENEATQS